MNQRLTERVVFREKNVGGQEASSPREGRVRTHWRTSQVIEEGAQKNGNGGSVIKLFLFAKKVNAPLRRERTMKTNRTTTLLPPETAR